jgi:hypothetical protein
MKPQDFHNKLAELMREAGKSNIPMVILVGILQCTLTDMVIQAVQQANREALKDLAEDIAKGKNDLTTN